MVSDVHRHGWDEHKAKRAAVAPAFAPSEMHRLAPILRKEAESVIESLPLDETFDWADRVSIELTTRMLATLLGFPREDRRRLTYWSDWDGDLGAMLDADLCRKRLEVLWECAGYFVRLRKARETQGGGNDLLSMMARSDQAEGCRRRNSSAMSSF